MLCGGIAFLFFGSSSFSFLFACGFISLPVFLRYFWRSQESYEKYYHIIHTNPLSQNNIKRRAISLFSIGLLGTFMSLWQVEVPQRIIVNYLSSINIFDEKYKDIASENSLYEARVYTKNTKKLFLIEIDEQDIYLCYKDKPFCEGTIEKIGERRLATYKYESTLHCALKLGGSCNWITPSNVGSFLGIYNLDNKINNKGK